MIVQFPIGPAGLTGLPDLAARIAEVPFGPQDPIGFADRLEFGFDPPGAQLVVPFDGFVRRVVPDAGPLPGDPFDLEIVPRIRVDTLDLRAALGGQIPRIRLLGIDPLGVGSALRALIEDQVTAVDPAGQGLPALEESFAQGAYSVFAPLGALLAAGVTQLAVQVLTRDGVASDPVAVFSDYLAADGDLVAERAWLEELLGVLTRRVLVQVVDEFGAPFRARVVVRRPGNPTPEEIFVSDTGGALVAAQLPDPPLVESIVINEPPPVPGEQPVPRAMLVSEWPYGGPHDSIEIPIVTGSSARTHRFVAADVRGWFASQWVQDPAVRLPRYTLGNNVEPLIDGIAYYRRLYDDIKALPSSGAGRFFYFSNWRLAQRLKLVRDEDDSVFEDLVRALVSDGVAVRILSWDQFHVESEELHQTLAEVLAISIVATGVLTMFAPPPVGLVAWALLISAFPLAPALSNSALMQRFISTQFETNERSVARLRELGADALLDGKVRMTREPPTLPLLYDFIGSHHQKFAVLASESGAVGYCGAMDVWPDRLDDPDHISATPYHDLHARVTGPAVADLIDTFRQRWNDHPSATSADADGTPPLPTTGHHVVQVARTYPRDLTPAGDRYPFAPDGDFTIRESLRRAIRRARRYIYLEDQYMTFPFSADPDNDFRELIKSQLRQRPELRLVMVVPRASDQPENTLRRAQFLGQLLEEFPDPSRIMTFFRTRVRPVVHPTAPGTITSSLRGDIDALATVLHLEDAASFREQGFVRIGSEEIKYGERDASSNTLTLGPEGRRGLNNTGIGPHPKGAPVHQIEYHDVFIHPKMWLIDDLFATIGSANANMRGITHDSECNLFVFDGEVDREARRFVKQLRVDLWADHLGLPHSGAIRLLLDDVEAALRLLATHPSPAAGQLRRFWREFNTDLIPESWLGFLGSAGALAPYWDAVAPTGILDLNEFWDHYVDPDGSIPFT